MDRYASYNREERFWCFLLTHSLLSSKNIRNKILTKIKEVGHIGLDENNLKVFIETAIIRDYWFTLGKDKKPRIEFIKKLFNVVGIENNIDIENERLFYTTDKRNQIASPSRWAEKYMKKFDDNKKNLLKIKWAFNAKPDIMLMDDESFVFIEAKVESKESDYKGSIFSDIKSKQTDIQELIVKIIVETIPPFNANKKGKAIMLDKKGNGLIWSEIKNIITFDAEIDNFTKECFKVTKLF